jgi:hypothetical protein
VSGFGEVRRQSGGWMYRSVHGFEWTLLHAGSLTRSHTFLFLLRYMVKMYLDLLLFFHLCHVVNENLEWFCEWFLRLLHFDCHIFMAEIEIKLSIRSETLDKSWMSNNYIGEPFHKKKEKK